MLTGPMHKKPNATRPKAKIEPTPTGGWPLTSSTIIRSLRPSVLTPSRSASLDRVEDAALKAKIYGELERTGGKESPTLSSPCKLT